MSNVCMSPFSAKGHRHGSQAKQAKYDSQGYGKTLGTYQIHGGPGDGGAGHAAQSPHETKGRIAC